MKNLNILKIEVVFQIFLTIVLTVKLILAYDDSNFLIGYAMSLLFVAIANFVGYCTRLIFVISKIHAYYFWGLLLFIIFSILFSLINENITKYLLISVSPLFNFFYIGYGIYLIKNWNPNINLRRN